MPTALFVAKLTAKGQTTIPSKVRKFLGLTPGDSILFALEEDTVTLKRENVPAYRAD